MKPPRPRLPWTTRERHHFCAILACAMWSWNCLFLFLNPGLATDMWRALCH